MLVIGANKGLSHYQPQEVKPREENIGDNRIGHYEASKRVYGGGDKV